MDSVAIVAVMANLRRSGVVCAFAVPSAILVIVILTQSASSPQVS